MIAEDIIMSQKPYLIRAMYEWMLDFGYTPRLVISPLVKGVVLPDHLLSLQQVTLDISPRAVAGIELGNHQAIFDAQFSNTPFRVTLPLNAIGAIIAKEKEVGYVFDIDDHLPKNLVDLNEGDTKPAETKVALEVETHEPFEEQQRLPRSFKNRQARQQPTQPEPIGNELVKTRLIPTSYRDLSKISPQLKAKILAEIEAAEKAAAEAATIDDKPVKTRLVPTSYRDLSKISPQLKAKILADIEAAEKAAELAAAKAAKKKLSRSGRPMRRSIHKTRSVTANRRTNPAKPTLLENLKNMFDE